MTYRPQPATDLTRRRRARIMLLALVFILGKGLPMPSMAAERGHATPTPTTASHCAEAASHTSKEFDPSPMDPTTPPQSTHDSCCPSGMGACALHCAMSLPLSIPSIALEPASCMPGHARVPSLVQRALPPPQRPPKA